MGISFSGSSLGSVDESLQVSVSYSTGFAALRVLGFTFEPDTYGGDIPAVDVVAAAPMIALAEDCGDRMARVAEERGDYELLNCILQSDRELWVRRVARRIVAVAKAAIAVDANAKVSFS